MDLAELRAASARKGVSNREIAKELNLSDTALYNKTHGKTEFKNSEIKALANMLGLSMGQVNQIFFDGIVN